MKNIETTYTNCSMCGNTELFFKNNCQCLWKLNGFSSLIPWCVVVIIESKMSAGEELESNAAANLSTITMMSKKTQFNKFADYFVICGLDLDSGLEPDLNSGK